MAFYYTIISLAGCVLHRLAPGAISVVTDSGNLSMALAYAFIPHYLLPHIVSSAFLPLLAWHLEPRLGLGRSFLLLAMSAVAGSAWFVLVGNSVPFVGGTFILSGYLEHLDQVFSRTD